MHGGMVDLLAVTGLSFALALVAHRCRRSERRHAARLVSMRWNEIAESNRERTRVHRAAFATRRAVGHTLEILVLVGVCFGAAAVLLVAQG